MAKKISGKNGGAQAAAGKKQTFSITVPAAQTVLLVGDFTQWQERPISMTQGAGGVWTATVVLPPGTHYYRFLVDGEWQDDPECTMRLTNPYGSDNSVREVA